MEALVRSFIVSELGKETAMIEAIAGDNELLETVERIAEVCATSIEQNGKVMFAGNGGTAADAQHLAAELVGKLVYARPAMPAIALTTDTSILTAVGNDFGYHKIFVRQIEKIQEGHIMVGQISCSLVEREIHPEQSI